MQSDPIVIVSAARTPMGAFQGELKGFAAPERVYSLPFRRPRASDLHVVP